MLEFSLSVINVVPLLKLFQAERPFVVFFYEKLQTLSSILKRFVRSDVLDENRTPRKFMAIDVNNKKTFYQLNQSMLDLGQERS